MDVYNYRITMECVLGHKKLDYYHQCLATNHDLLYNCRTSLIHSKEWEVKIILLMYYWEMLCIVKNIFSQTNRIKNVIQSNEWIT